MILLLLSACEWRIVPPVEVPPIGACGEGIVPTPVFRDVDGDGQGDPGTVQQGCLPVDGWVALDGDCDDGDATIYANAPELCNDLDDDCDLTVDEAPERLWCADRDEDGYGDEGDGVHSCEKPGSDYIEDCGDCDDRDVAVSPDAVEVDDGIDNDCDDQVDE